MKFPNPASRRNKGLELAVAPAAETLLQRDLGGGIPRLRGLVEPPVWLTLSYFIYNSKDALKASRQNFLFIATPPLKKIKQEIAIERCPTSTFGMFLKTAD